MTPPNPPVLISEDAIQARVTKLAEQISRDCAGIEYLLVVGVLRGAFIFMADLVRYLSTAPLYHSAPLRFALAVTAGGGTVFLMEKFDAALALDLLEREGITHSQWVPTMFQRLLALPQAQRAAFTAPAHRAAIFGAAPCPPGKCG